MTAFQSSAFQASPAFLTEEVGSPPPVLEQVGGWPAYVVNRRVMQKINQDEEILLLAFYEMMDE